jgi:heme oxygenase
LNAPSIIATRLRQATKAAHHRLDHHPLLAALLDPAIDLERYGDGLAALHGVFSAAENLVAGLNTIDFPHCPRTPALDADLANLGRLPLPFAGRLSGPDTAGARIGLLYVLEGSALGGQVLARQLRATLGPECPLRFFTGQGEGHAAGRWAAFWNYASSSCDPADFPAAEEAAKDLFAAFCQHLDWCLSLLRKTR